MYLTTLGVAATSHVLGGDNLLDAHLAEQRFNQTKTGMPPASPN
ncbi:hypothetical protein OK016_16860 [Vibrio chagasii]|nr:hypothetical protein [Vibrio chagasii]